jgi:hypothetical protein
MTALWSLMLRLSANPATLLCLNLAMFWAGLTLCLEAVNARAVTRLVLMLGLGLMPLTLVEMAHLLTDAHLTAVLVLATGLAVWGLRALRPAPLWLSLAMLIYAGAVRYNALAATLPLGALLAGRIVRVATHRRAVALVSAIAVAVLSLGVGFALDRTMVTDRVTAWQTIALWDLAAMSVDSGELLLPSFTHGAGLTVTELRKPGFFDPTANTYLFQGTHTGMRDGLGEPYTPAQLRELRWAWIHAVLRFPGAYIRHRLRTFWLLIGPHRGTYYGAPYFVSRTQYRDNPPLPNAVEPGFQQIFYALAFILRPSWIFAALPYLLLSVAALVIGVARRHSLLGQLAVAVASGALLYAAGFLPLAPAADLRYLTWPIVAGPLALSLALFAWRRPCRRVGDARSREQDSRIETRLPETRARGTLSYVALRPAFGTQPDETQGPGLLRAPLALDHSHEHPIRAARAGCRRPMARMAAQDRGKISLSQV